MIPGSQHFLEVVPNIFIYAHVHSSAFWAMQNIKGTFPSQRATALLPTAHTHTSQASEKLHVQTSYLNNARNTQAKNPTNKQHAVSSYPSPTLLSWEVKSQFFSTIGGSYSDTTHNMAE